MITGTEKLKDAERDLVRNEAIESIERIAEGVRMRFDMYQTQVSPDYWNEKYEFGFASTDEVARKARPYRDWASLQGVQHIGNVLYQYSDVAYTIIETLKAYAVGGSGIDYTVSARRNQTASATELNRAQKAIDRLIGGCDWARMQAEGFGDRWLTAGDVFRFVQPDGKRLEWSYVDSHEVEPPDWEGQEDARPEFGIEYQMVRTRAGEPRVKNVSKPTRYWVNGSPIPARNMLHMKQGVDSKAERGIPLLFRADCSIHTCEGLRYAAFAAALEFTKHTIIYLHDQQNSDTQLIELAKGVAQLDRAAQDEGKPNAGGAVHQARGYSVEMLAQMWSADGYDKQIENEYGRIAQIASLPVAFITGRLGDASRANLFAAQSPTTRRVQMMEGSWTCFDIDLLYIAIAVEFSRFPTSKADQDWLQDFRDRVAIKPTSAIPDSQERNARSAMVVNEVNAGLKSRPRGIQELGSSLDEYIQETRDYTTEMDNLDQGLGDEYRPEQLVQMVDAFKKLVSPPMAITPEAAARIVNMSEALLTEIMENGIEPIDAPPPPPPVDQAEDREETEEELETVPGDGAATRRNRDSTVRSGQSTGSNGDGT